MEEKARIDEFYRRLCEFLLFNELEEQLVCYSNEQIENSEAYWGVNLPYAYKLFLRNFANGDPRIFSDQDYSLSGIISAIETSTRIVKADQTELPAKAFVFSQRQDYSFFYFEMGTENPQVIGYIEGDGTPDSHEIFESKSFTDWVCERVAEHLNYLNNVKKLPVAHLLTELGRIKKSVRQE